MGKKKSPKKKRVRPWDNIIMEWNTPPSRVRLHTDSQVSISWPFGDDVADMMSSLDDKYFKVFMKKAWALCQEEAKKRPESQRATFLANQRARLDAYKEERENNAG